MTRRRRLLVRGLPTLLVLVVGLILVGHAIIGGPGRGAARSADSAGLARPSARTAPSRGAPSTAPAGLTTAEKARLTNALTAYLTTRTGQAAVGLLDLRTGATYCLHCSRRFVTASVVKVDILEALLLRAQDAHVGLSAEQRELATEMIENSDNDAASSLYWDDDDNDGIAAANRTLGLTDTTIAAGGLWGDTRTTVGDQLVLLRDLMSSQSPLDAASRRYARSLMGAVEADQRWGVPAAAAGRRFLVKNGWLPRDLPPPNWAVNSDGVLLAASGKDPLAISVLTAHDPTMAYGEATIAFLARSVAAPLSG